MYLRVGFARLSGLCELPQCRVIVAGRSPVSRAAIRGEEPLDDAAVAQPREGTGDLLDGNSVDR